MDDRREEENDVFAKVKLGFSPHAGTYKCPGGQVRLISLTLMFKIVVAAVGRRFGKTQAAKMAIYEQYRHCKDRVFNAAYCGPTFARVKPEFDEFCQMFKGIIDRVVKSEMVIYLKRTRSVHGNIIDKGVIRFWSLDQHDNLRGSKMHFIVIDECSEVAEAAYTATLTPMTADTGGHFLLIGTPRRVGVGFVWFRREFIRATSDPYWQAKGYAGMTGPTEGNPYLMKDGGEALRELRERAPDPLTRREEYDAEFIMDTGAVFDVSGCFTIPAVESGDSWAAEDLKIKPDEKFTIGYDIGLFEDPGIISVFRHETDQKLGVFVSQVHLERFIGRPFAWQYRRLKELRARFNGAMVYADVNGMGEVPQEMMSRDFGMSFVGIKWSNKSKEEDVMRGMGMFQQKRWRFLAIKWQQEEFFEFTRKKLPSGVWRYEHPEGGHDDAVAASLLPSSRLSIPMLPPPPEVAKKNRMVDPETGELNVDYFAEAGERIRRAAIRRGYYR